MLHLYKNGWDWRQECHVKQAKPSQARVPRFLSYVKKTQGHKSKKVTTRKVDGET